MKFRTSKAWGSGALASLGHYGPGLSKGSNTSEISYTFAEITKSEMQLF